MLFKSQQFFKIPLSSSCFLVFLSLSYSYWFVGLLKWIVLGRTTNCVHFNWRYLGPLGQIPWCIAQILLSKLRYSFPKPFKLSVVANSHQSPSLGIALSQKEISDPSYDPTLQSMPKCRDDERLGMIIKDKLKPLLWMHYS